MGKITQLAIIVLMVTASEGCHAERQDDLKSILYSAEHGDTRSQLKLGFRYRFGIGVSMDHEQAAHWYLKASNGGHPGAQMNIGLMYSGGEVVPRNDKMAEKWL
ncbi:MAG: sel1 repeat family protein [Magnetococcus sp. YQC-3]